MKKLIILAFFMGLFFSCQIGIKPKVITEQEKIEDLQFFLADGVILDEQRPMLGILSEQEVMIKAASIAVSQGVLDPTYYRFNDNPELLTARIETPILEHTISGEPISYFLHVVDENRNFLLGANVRCDENVEDINFISTFYETMPNRSENVHYVTKREVDVFLQSRFSDKKISEPVAIVGLRLENSPYSSSQVFWYFQVENQDRSILSEKEEYIIDAYISEYYPLSGNNRSVINSEYRGSPHLRWFRMAKLSRPLNLQYYTRYSSRSIFENSTTGNNLIPMGYTGVSLD